MISISPVKGSNNAFVTTETFDFIMDESIIKIPKGFKFDGASIPRFLWIFIGHPFSPRFIEASLVHDYLCIKGYDRKSADRKFKELLKRAGVSSWKATAMYNAVRAFSMVMR